MLNLTLEPTRRRTVAFVALFACILASLHAPARSDAGVTWADGTVSVVTFNCGNGTLRVGATSAFGQTDYFSFRIFDHASRTWSDWSRWEAFSTSWVAPMPRGAKLQFEVSYAHRDRTGRYVYFNEYGWVSQNAFGGGIYTYAGYCLT